MASEKEWNKQMVCVKTRTQKTATSNSGKRAVKKAIVPGYGKKGAGWVKNPKKAAYNKVYKKTSFSLFDLFK